MSEPPSLPQDPETAAGGGPTASPSAQAVAPEAAVPFEFGKNWQRFLARLDDRRIASARQSIELLLQRTSLAGLRFLDAGSGSGLFSLAACQLGADVTSFDVDPASVACAEELRSRYASDRRCWTIGTGSLLDDAFLRSLGTFDVVYCWGVAHHTGAMWRAIDNLSHRVAPGGTIILALYNDQQYVSRAWSGVKRIYQKLPRILRPVYVAAIGAATFAKRVAATSAASLLRLSMLRNPVVPFANWIRETQARGMHVWHDLVDWVGGWPFQVARPEEVFRFLRDRGFTLQDMTTSGGHGCNEFVFRRMAD